MSACIRCAQFAIEYDKSLKRITTLEADLAATRAVLRRVVEAAGRVCKYPGPDDWRILEDTLAAALEERA